MKLRLSWQRRYPHPPSRVWQALTNSAALASWLMPNDFAPRVGHRFFLHAAPCGAGALAGVVVHRGSAAEGGGARRSTIGCVVAELIPLTRLAFTWRDGEVDGVIAFDLAPDGDGTRLDLSMIGASAFIPEDSPDRIGVVLDRMVVDPGGHVWSFASH